jgi:hypothetical protein
MDVLQNALYKLMTSSIGDDGQQKTRKQFESSKGFKISTSLFRNQTH